MKRFWKWCVRHFWNWCDIDPDAALWGVIRKNKERA